MRKPPKKLPGQSWTIKEKLDWVVAVLTDHRLTYATRVIGATMAVHFHNTQSGDLYPSRPQIGEKVGVHRSKIILATQSLRKHGYLTYEDSDGGCNHRNTYHLLKQSEKVTVLHPNSAEKGTVNRTQKGTPPVPKRDAQGYAKRDAQLSLESTTCEKTPEALPLPRKGEASASVEKREEGLQCGALGEPSRSTEAAREAHVAEVERRLGRAFGSKR
jgi:biotin operon repressor